MLIRFKYGDGTMDIYNTEHMRECLNSKHLHGESITIIAEHDSIYGERIIEFSSWERAIEALDKIYTAYADGARAITIELD